MPDSPVEVVLNKAASRYEAMIDGEVAFVAYEEEPGNRLVLTHTEVPEALAGRGIAAQLARTALDDARVRKLTVVPQCAYVASYVKRHPEYEDLLAK